MGGHGICQCLDAPRRNRRDDIAFRKDPSHSILPLMDDNRSNMPQGKNASGLG
jgi:hypothetical protein